MALPLEQSARLLGHYQWIEARLFELLGSRVPAVAEIEVKLHLHAQASRHAWHAELWQAQLPDVPGLEPETLTTPPTEQLGGLFDALAQPSEPDGTVTTLVATCRVLLPRMVGAYLRHSRHASSLADAPTLRCLRLVLADELEGWREGELLLQSLLRRPDEVHRAGSRQADLEARLVEGGGFLRAQPAAGHP